MGDSPTQGYITTLEVPTQDLEKMSSGPSTLDAQKIARYNGQGKDKAEVTWVFTWSEIVTYFLQTVGLVAVFVFGVWAIKTYNAAKNSLDIATTANDLSRTALVQSSLANQLALLAFCATVQAGPPSHFSSPCSAVTESLLLAVIGGVAPSSSSQSPRPTSATTLPPSISSVVVPTTSVAVPPTPLPSPSTDGNVSTATLTSTGIRPVGTIYSSPTATSSKHTVHFSVVIGIIVAVVVLFVVAGAFLVGRKRFRVSIRLRTYV